MVIVEDITARLYERDEQTYMGRTEGKNTGNGTLFKRNGGVEISEKKSFDFNGPSWNY